MHLVECNENTDIFNTWDKIYLSFTKMIFFILYFSESI